MIIIFFNKLLSFDENFIISIISFILFFQKSYSQINDANTLYEQLTSKA